MEYGVTLKIKKDSHKIILRTCSNKCESATVAFEQASQLLKISNKDLFKQINLIFPGLEKYHYNYDHIKQSVIIKELKEKEI